MISPRNYFLFTPLLPSVAIGTLDPRSIIQPTRYITRHKGRTVHVYEAEATDVDVSTFCWQADRVGFRTGISVIMSLTLTPRFYLAREQDSQVPRSVSPLTRTIIM